MDEGVFPIDETLYLPGQTMVVTLAAALFAFVAVYVALARPRVLFGDKTAGSAGRKLGLFLALLAGTAALIFPLVLRIQGGNLLVTIPLLGVRLLQAVVLDNGFVDYISGLPQGWLASLYYFLIGCAYVALPLVGAMNVYDLIMLNISRLATARTTGVACRGKNVYLFSDFNANTYGLAQDVLGCDRRALVVFGSMSKLERDTWSTEIARLEADRVKCFEADYVDLAVRFCRSFRFATLKCFAISEHCEDDVAQTCRALRALRLGSGSLGMGRSAFREAGGDAFGPAHPGADAQAAGMGSGRADIPGGAFACPDARERVGRVRLYVTSDSVDDQIVLDAANGRGDRGDAAPSLQLTVLNEATMAVYDLLYRAPLHCVLDNEPVPAGGVRPTAPTELSVLVLGSGRYAEEALKAVLWHGQMHNVALNVDVAAPDANDMGERVFMRHPELASSSRFSLRFTDVAMLSPRLDTAYLRRYVGCSHLYIVVALEDDALSFEVAMHARMFFLSQWTSRSEDVGRHPFISCLVRSDATSSLITSQFDEGMPGYGLVPFGCSRALFGYRGIIDSPLERAGQAAADLYDVLWSGLQGLDFANDDPDVGVVRKAVAASIAEAGSSVFGDAVEHADGGIACMPQIRHNSNLALALHARYKAWAQGVDSGCASAADQDSRPGALAQPDSAMRPGSAAQPGSATLPALSDEACLAMGLSEHDRWTVFYQTQGFTYLSVEEQERMSRLLGGKNARHKIEPLRKHTLICENDEIWSNYLHAMGGFSYEERSSMAPGCGKVSVQPVGMGEHDGPERPAVAMQLLDADYRVVDEWTTCGESHECAGLADGAYFVHPASALPGRSCAPDTPFELRDGQLLAGGAPVACVEADVSGAPLVNPVIYDWAFVMASPYLVSRRA